MASSNSQSDTCSKGSAGARRSRGDTWESGASQVLPQTLSSLNYD